MTDVSRAAVLAAMKEYHEADRPELWMGRTFKRTPLRYWVIGPGYSKPFPSKPIAARALGWEDVNGGYSKHDSACNVLERAGFVITDAGGRPWKTSTVSTSLIEKYEAAIAKIELAEAIREARIRIGQQQFRKCLDEKWNNTCAVTGISQRELLRASHIRPWSECDDDIRKQLDPDNGILLSALWDLAFENGLVSFSDDGEVIASGRLSKKSRKQLQFDNANKFKLNHRQREYMAWHRKKWGFCV